MKSTRLLFFAACVTPWVVFANPPPMASAYLVFAEEGGVVAVEAEHFFKQELTTARAWHVISPANRPRLTPDTDGTHLINASGGAYIEALPDTRWTHDEKLVRGENFSDEPGKIAVLSYKVHFSKAGRYHFWARAYSTGTEDNGFHVGINGTWPDSGQRWQTTKKRAWQWDSRQRTKEVHNGVPGQLFIDVPSAGEHVIQISMREDGFEMDKWLMTTDATYTPDGAGPAPRVKKGALPAAYSLPGDFKEDAAPTPFTPKPAAKKNAAKPAATAANKETAPSTPAAPTPAAKPSVGAEAATSATNDTVLASALKLDGSGFYLDRGKWAAINPNKNKEAAVQFVSPAANGRYNLTLHVVGENDGNSSFEVLLGGRSLGRFAAAPSREIFEEGPAFTHTWNDVLTSEGEIVEVRAAIASSDGKEYSRARWSKLVFSVVETDPGRAPVAVKSSPAPTATAPVARQPDGSGKVSVIGELKQWHKVTVDLAGPFAAETDTTPNPFTDYRFTVTFTHESGAPRYTVPGYFAADGDAANSSASAGTIWRAHLSPDKPGKWTYRVDFKRGRHAALDGGGEPVAPYDGKTGSFEIGRTDKSGRDFRAHGRLSYVNGHYLKFAGSGQVFIKVGTDSPETMLGYKDFDGTVGRKPTVPLKTWSPHLKDWRAGNPVWAGEKGKGLIGALNYLAEKGANAFSFLTYNAGGDGDNVWPFISRDQKFNYDCSKLDQWEIVFNHADQLGLFLHFKLQEQENDDNRIGPKLEAGQVPTSLDGGDTGPERKLYLRELVARFGHHLALNWNLGEENTQSTEQLNAMMAYLEEVDPYDHPIVVHTFIPAQDKIYTPLLGAKSKLHGTSLQNGWDAAHQRTLKWVRESAAAGRPWVVCNDEQGPAWSGIPPDAGYAGYANKNSDGKTVDYTTDDTRQQTLWGTLLAGGAGVEYYFGYKLPENDLVAEDLRSRDRSWDYARHAIEFFSREKIPVEKMKNADELLGNAAHDNSLYCFAQPGELYLAYLPKGGTASLDLSAAPGKYSVSWFNPRDGGALTKPITVDGGTAVKLTAPDTSDWLAVVRLKR